MFRPKRGRAAFVLLCGLLLFGCGVGGWSFWISRPEVAVIVGNGQPSPIGTVHFGGPDLPAGALRTMLLRRVRQTPPGQRIDWATYYFLDRELAGALIAASDRGVKVTLAVEGDPRLENANNGVLALLRAHGLDGGLAIRPEAPFPLEVLGGKLHSKIYAFSWPRPVALVGSFNPSGGAGPRQAVVDEIGDQDRGHNLLVEITSPGLVRALVDHVHMLAANGGQVGRFSSENNRIIADGGTALYFYPRLRPDIIEQAVDRMGPGDTLRAAISHLKNESVGTLIDAAERGATLDLIVHDTERRVPQQVVDRLRFANIRVRRYHDAEGLPMHAKFFVIDNSGERSAYFGSLNFNRNSRLLNDEVLVRSNDRALIATLLRRFDVISREVDAQGTTQARPAATR